MAATALAGPALARKAATPSWYSNALIVDGLGGINDPYSADDALRLTDRAWAEMRMTGIAAVRDTLLPVGNYADSWEQFSKNLDEYHDRLSANPDRLILVEKAADIAAAKKAGKLGIILGTQDTAMAGPALDRLAEMKKRGVRCVQLTYSRGTGRSSRATQGSPISAATRSGGSRRRSCCLISRTAGRARSRRRSPSPIGR
jgi:membrane dipeptidase